MKKVDLQTTHQNNLQDQEQRSFILNLEQEAIELLSNAEVDTVAKNIDDNIHYINGTSPNNSGIKQNHFPFNEKLKRFLNKDNSKNFLFEYWQKMDSESLDFSTKEGAILDQINNKLLQNFDVTTLLVEILIAAQKQNLLGRKVSPKIIEIEIQHIKDVVALTRNIFPKLPILHLVASVHDSYKHVEDNYNELGLHELTSTAFGSTLVKTILERHKQKIGITSEEITLLNKLVMRAIFTHGTNEFPRNNAVYSKEYPKIGILNGNDIHIKPKRNSFDESNNLSKTVKYTIVGINYLDALTGIDSNSLIKYNLASKSKKIAQYPSVGDYFFVSLFNSFESNVNMPAGRELRKLNNPNLETHIAKNREIKRLLEWSLKHKSWYIYLWYGKKSGAEIKEKRNYLILQFKKLQETVNESSLDQNSSENKVQQQRIEFDVAIENFVNCATNIVTSSRQR